MSWFGSEIQNDGLGNLSLVNTDFQAAQNALNPSFDSDVIPYLEGLFSSTGENILQSMEFNSAEAQKNRDFQERLANSAYQRAVEDLRRAGLNPLLAYGAAAQAATPSSTSASVNTVTGDTLGSLLSVLAALMSSSADVMKAFTSIKR